MLLLYLFSSVEWDLILFSWLYNTKQSPEILNLKIEMLLEFHNVMNMEIIAFYRINLGFVLDLSDIELLDIDLWDKDLDLLDADIDSLPVNIFLIFKTCLEDILKTYWGHALKTSWRCLQRKTFLSSKTFWRGSEDAFQDVSEMSWRRLQNTLKTSWKTRKCYAEDVLKTSWYLKNE